MRAWRKWSPARSTRTLRLAAASSLLSSAGVEVEHVDSFEARAQNAAWRAWIVTGRPFVTLKLAVTLDGRVTVPGARWVTGEESRRRVHELRAASDAVAVGMGTVRADDPRLDARDVDATRQPRRIAFGGGPLPEDSELELLSGPLEDELRRLGGEGVQSLLIEGGPKLATAFLEHDLVDRLLVFVAPTIAGEGQVMLGALPGPVELRHLRADPSAPMSSSMPTSMSPEGPARRPPVALARPAHRERRAALRDRDSRPGGALPEQAEALDELLAELERTGPNGRGDLEMVVRETLEALALG